MPEQQEEGGRTGQTHHQAQQAGKHHIGPEQPGDNTPEQAAHNGHTEEGGQQIQKAEAIVLVNFKALQVIQGELVLEGGLAPDRAAGGPEEQPLVGHLEPALRPLELQAAAQHRHVVLAHRHLALI